MKRRNPSQERSRKTVNAIIRALNRIICADGYGAASTARIAKEAGVGIATVYGYFEDKEDILVSLLERQGAEVLQQLTDGAQKWMLEDRKVAVRNFIQFIVEEISEQAALTKTVMIHAPHLIDSPKTARVVGQFEMVMRLIFGQAENRTGGEFDNNTRVDSFIAINVILGLILGLANGLPADVSKGDVSKRMEVLVFTFLEMNGT